ncbi:hypothetical protein KCP74_20615 [Salmonella enterica subsp. enterica]|nr:hypothetical protein KCP74_20615 [Salmonella enterica subsp. enterica]
MNFDDKMHRYAGDIRVYATSTLRQLKKQPAAARSLLLSNSHSKSARSTRRTNASPALGARHPNAMQPLVAAQAFILA